MTSESHKKDWESYRDMYSDLYKSTNEDIYKMRYDACKRLLGEAPIKPKIDFFQ